VFLCSFSEEKKLHDLSRNSLLFDQDIKAKLPVCGMARENNIEQFAQTKRNDLLSICARFIALTSRHIYFLQLNSTLNNSSMSEKKLKNFLMFCCVIV
jgi:hypothetical protein